jgi:predicted dehydrogenase
MAQENVAVVGITDINPEHAHALAEKFGVTSYPNLEQMLAEAKLDVLDVVTSRGMHYEPIMAGMAVPLTPKDIEDVTAYYSAQPAVLKSSLK